MSREGNRIEPQGPLRVSANPPTEPAMPPKLEMPQEIRAGQVVNLIHLSDEWKLSEWSVGDLVLSQASLKHVLKLVEREMGQRKLIAPHRETR